MNYYWLTFIHGYYRVGFYLQFVVTLYTIKYLHAGMIKFNSKYLMILGRILFPSRFGMVLYGFIKIVGDFETCSGVLSILN